MQHTPATLHSPLAFCFHMLNSIPRLRTSRFSDSSLKAMQYLAMKSTYAARVFELITWRLQPSLLMDALVGTVGASVYYE